MKLKRNYKLIVTFQNSENSEKEELNGKINTFESAEKRARRDVLENPEKEGFYTVSILDKEDNSRNILLIEKIKGEIIVSPFI